MPILIDCPVCGQRLRVPNFAAGRITKCTSCGNAVRVPRPKDMLEEGKSEPEKAEGNKLEEPFSVSELGYRSYERFSTWLDWLADRPIRILFVALICVGCYVGVAAAKWALSKPKEGPIVSVDAEDLEPWEGVGLTDANDQVRVTAKSVGTQQIDFIPTGWNNARKSPQACLRVALRIENLGPSEIKYTGWAPKGGNNSGVAHIKDDAGIAHHQVNWTGKIVGQQTPPATIAPSKSIEEVLVFNHPGTYPKYLKLTLPAEACGGTGVLRIKIPRTQSLD
jgi:hypothetical protein